MRMAWDKSPQEAIISGLSLVNLHSRQLNGFRKIAVNHRLLFHANHLLSITTRESVPIESRYTVAKCLLDLSSIFRSTATFGSSPIFTAWFGTVQEHPNQIKETECHKLVISLCRDMDEQRFKDLQREALDHLSDGESLIGGYNRPWKKLLENRACRATSHPNRSLCPQCFRNLHMHIFPEPIVKCCSRYIEVNRHGDSFWEVWYGL